MNASLKRFSKGFLKTIGVFPKAEAAPQVGSQSRPNDFSLVRQKLGTTFTVEDVDLASAEVPGNIDLLLLLAPEHMGDKEIYAVDQFLMKGGTVIVSSWLSALIRKVHRSKRTESGLSKWLNFYGIEIEDSWFSIIKISASQFQLNA